MGYFTLGANGMILEANLTAANLFGIERESLLNRPFSGLVDPASLKAFQFHLKKAMKGGPQEGCELGFRKCSGASFFGHLESLPVLPSNLSTPPRIRVTVIDITGRKLAENSLRETAKRNELLLNLLPHPAILLDRNRKILAANRLAKKNGVVVGHSFSSSQSRPSHVIGEKSRKAREEADVAGPQGVFLVPQGENSPERLSSVIEDSNDAVTVLDLEGGIKAWNSRAEKIYGYTEAEALKMTIYDLVPSRLKKGTRDLLRDVAAGVLCPPFETRRVAKDGCLVDVWLTVTRLVRGDQIVAVATTERDITDQNRLLDSIKKLPQRIILAQEKERKRVSQEIHSDFGQSLIALKMLVSFSASTMVDPPAEVKLLIEEIKKRLGRIIKRARDLAHELAPPSLKYVGLVQAIQNLVDSQGGQRRLKISFEHRNLDSIAFKGRDIIIFRIVQEALNNIFKHARATRARIKAVARKSTFFLEICDNGKGFVPAAPRRSGGLGLDLMREQAVLIHGSLSIDSCQGKGTTIRISVPIRDRGSR